MALGVLVLAILVIAILAVPWSQATPSRAVQQAAVSTLPEDAVERGKRLHATLRPGSYGSLLVGLAAALALGLTPLGARIVELAGRITGGHWVAEALLGGLVVAFAGQIVTLPFAAWRHVVLRRYGLSTQDWGGWFADLGRAAGVTAVLGAVALLGFYGVTRLAPRWWWAWAAGGAAGLVVLFSFVFPVLVAPVFNRFTPMPESPLRQQLLALAERDGIPVREVLIADASRRTTAVNAYVAGLGATRRIVVYDTLLEAAPPEEVVQVVAHELGHAKRRDVVLGTTLGALGAAAGVCAVYLLGGWSGLLRRAGVSDIAEPRGVALLLAIMAVAGLLAMPLQNAVSRRIEARADAYALALTEDPETFAAMQRRLAIRNLADVDPPRWAYLLFASHPSTAERIAAAMEYARR